MCPHHLTQRGNARQYILNRDEDRAVYLKLLRENIEVYNVSLLGYCLMSNHVHLIAVPTLPDGLALACRNAHGRYAAYWNAIHGASGHAWQGRFYSCPPGKFVTRRDWNFAGSGETVTTLP
jgi:putative transposase